MNKRFTLRLICVLLASALALGAFSACGKAERTGPEPI